MCELIDIIGSKSRAEVFKLLFDQPGKEIYLRELHRLSGLSIRPIQQELDNLLAVGLIKSRKDGNRVYYSADTNHPLFPEITKLVEKTTGYQSMIRKALSIPEVKFAFIFGSIASGKARSDSDLDLFVIGDVGLRRVSSQLNQLSQRIGRIINPYSMTVDEFRQKILSKNHFVTSVMDTKKIFLIGDEDELKRVGKKRLAKTA